MPIRNAVEEFGSLRYRLRFLGVNIDNVYPVYGDNLDVIQNATIKDIFLKKKHLVISHYKVREAVAAVIIVQTKITSKGKCSECLTKALPVGDHNPLVNGIFHG